MTKEMKDTKQTKQVTTNVIPISPDLIKKHGKLAFVRGSDIKVDKTKNVSIGPALDVLTGVVPSSCNVVLSGPPKCGKTISSLQIAANAQQHGRTVYFFNIEGRIKLRDMEGIKDLDLDKLIIIRSYKNEETGETKIFTAEEFLTVAEDIMNTVDGAVLIFDSVSMLATAKELESDLEDAHRAPGPVLMSRFLKRMSNVTSVNNIITIAILHIIANTSGFGKINVRSGGRKILFAADIDLECKSFKFFTDPNTGKVVGQEVEWITHATPTVGPGQKITSIIRYGVGIDKIEELVTLATSIGYISKNGAWYTLSFLEHVVDNWDEGKEYKFQGKDKVRKYLMNHPDHFSILYDQVMEVLAP